MDIRDFFVILASGSPRRIEMLQAEGIDPLVIKSSCSEDIRLDLSPACFVMSLAFRKGQSVLEQLQKSCGSGSGGSADGGLPEIPDKPVLMISADTIVCKDSRIIGKPADEADAFRILSDLRDAVNSVYSGVCLRVLDEGFSPVGSILLLCGRTSGWDITRMTTYGRTSRPESRWTRQVPTRSRVLSA